MKRFELDNYKEEIIKLYIDEKLSCEIISQKLNASLCGIYDALRRWGVKTRNLSDSHRQYNIDENYFDTINTEEKAYWLGFIYADGFITNPLSFRMKQFYLRICIDTSLEAILMAMEV